MRVLLIIMVVVFGVYSVPSQKVLELERLVETEKAFAKASRDLGVRRAFLEFLAQDGIIFEPGPVNGREKWVAKPNTSALRAWNPVWADISSNGRIGYTTGDWEYFSDRKDANPVGFGQYITIWAKQADGKFKAALDIGNSHQKPPETQKAWSSPQRTPGDAKPNVDNFFPITGIPDIAKYREMLADDVRLYREGRFPAIGKDRSLDQIGSELKETKDVKVIQTTCGGESDLMYCYGLIELTKANGTAQKGNLMRIWKARRGNWRIVIEIYTPIPTVNE